VCDYGSGNGSTNYGGFGLAPHFMVGIDAGAKEGEIHSNVKNKDIYFIYSNQVSTYSVDGYKGPNLL